MGSSYVKVIYASCTKETFLKHKFFIPFIAVFFVLSIAVAQTDDQTYVVRKGDTLWDLAFKFLGDPFAWPQLYHQNSFIKNPDRIFPGDKLYVGKKPPPDATGSGPAAANASASSSTATGEMQSQTAAVTATANSAQTSSNYFYSETKKAIDQSELKKSQLAANTKKMADEYDWKSDSLFSAAMKKKGYFTAEFLCKLGYLWFSKDSKGIVCPGNAEVGWKTPAQNGLKRYDQDMYKQFDELPIHVFSPSVKFNIGDTLDIIHADSLLLFGKETANEVRRVGNAVVTQINDSNVTAMLYRAWDLVKSEDRVEPAKHFYDLQIDSIIDPHVAIKGTIFLRIENTERPYMFHTFILDRGLKDGVVMGDLFAVVQKNDVAKNRPAAIACAALVNESSSTLVIEKLFNNDISNGDTVIALKRILFKQ